MPHTKTTLDCFILLAMIVRDLDPVDKRRDPGMIMCFPESSKENTPIILNGTEHSAVINIINTIHSLLHGSLGN